MSMTATINLPLSREFYEEVAGAMDVDTLSECLVHHLLEVQDFSVATIIRDISWSDHIDSDDLRTAVSDVMDHIDLEDYIDHSILAEYVCASDVAEYIEECDVAYHMNHYDVAEEAVQHIDMEHLAETIGEVADYGVQERLDAMEQEIVRLRAELNRPWWARLFRRREVAA